ncbi:MAG: hypothetical protein MZV64_01640 [Ignavibacteriales bacterium]|nr:hypothetical protein [Ignavibacteriales bacterium]
MHAFIFVRAFLLTGVEPVVSGHSMSSPPAWAGIPARTCRRRPSLLKEEGTKTK